MGRIKNFFWALLLFGLGLVWEVEARTPPDFLQFPPSIQQLIFFEQNFIYRRMGGNFPKLTGRGNKLDPKYYPEKFPVFELISLEIPIEDMKLTGVAGFPDQLIQSRSGRTFVNFLIHPESAKLYAPLIAKYPKGQKFLATSLSSYRSLVVWTPGQASHPMLIKVSLDRSIGAVLRRLEGVWINRAVAISALLDQIPRDDLASQGIVVIPEPLGLLPPLVDAGMQLREWPFEKASGKKIIPMFALYAGQVNGKTILSEMIEESGISPQEFVGKHIFEPLIRQADYLAFFHGIIGEPHAQNILMELDEKKQPTGNFWYRDLGGFSVDARSRAAAGKSIDQLPQKLREVDLSTRYNNFPKDLDIYLVDGNFYGLADSLKSRFPEITQAWIRKEFERIFFNSLTPLTGHRPRSLGTAQKAIKQYLKGNSQDSTKLFEGILESCRYALSILQSSRIK